MHVDEGLGVELRPREDLAQLLVQRFVPSECLLFVQFNYNLKLQITN